MPVQAASSVRESTDLPAGETAATRTDIELVLANLPAPIDLDSDPAERMLYWTDGGIRRAAILLIALRWIHPRIPPVELQVLIMHLGEGSA